VIKGAYFFRMAFPHPGEIPFQSSRALLPFDGPLALYCIPLFVTNSDDYGTLSRKCHVCLPLATCPVYFGLSLALLALSIKFFQEIFHVLPNIFSIAEADLVLTLLSLVDMALVGGLLVMVMFSGYENFVSQLDISENKEKLSWLGKMDATSLKNKVAASIVAISSIHLLRVFMDAKNVPDNKLMWYVIIHLTFVLSAFVMGYLDKLTRYKN
jgi:uncharacterized protein (TIGR00645 family)